MYVSCSGNKRKFNVWSTRLEHGAAKYNSKCRAEFHANVATRPCLEIFRLSSTPPSNRVRSAHSPYVVFVLPLAVAVMIRLSRL